MRPARYATARSPLWRAPCACTCERETRGHPNRADTLLREWSRRADRKFPRPPADGTHPRESERGLREPFPDRRWAARFRATPATRGARPAPATGLRARPAFARG